MCVYLKIRMDWVKCCWLAKFIFYACSETFLQIHTEEQKAILFSFILLRQLISHILWEICRMYIQLSVHVSGQLAIGCSLCVAQEVWLQKNRRRGDAHCLISPLLSLAGSLRSAWCVRALIFIQTSSVFCNHRAQGTQTYPGTLISICMGPLLLDSHTKGRRAMQPTRARW